MKISSLDRLRGECGEHEGYCDQKEKIGVRNRFRRSLELCVVVVVTNVSGNYALARGLRHLSSPAGWMPIAALRAVFHFWVAVGALLMVAWLVARLALLSWADLSYVLLVTSASYVLSALVGAIGLGEDVTWFHWLGICIITCGILIAARTYPRTTNHHLEIDE